MDEKKSGSYYTPYKTVSFMSRYLLEQKKLFKSILEPSAGDGRFIEEFIEYGFVESIIAVELYEEKANLLFEKKYPQSVTIIASDFLEFAKTYNKKFQLIIGNPPYINIKNMEKDFLEKAKSLCTEYELNENTSQNAWVAFVLASLSLLDEKGAIFFVLPLEFLQVHYAEQLREVLEKKFDTIHILTFAERMFPDIEQEACLVYLTNEEQEQKLPYILYKKFDRLDSLQVDTESRIERNKPLKKWTNAILSDTEIDTLNSIGERYTLINDVGESAPGIVTGANSKFILTEQEVQSYECENFVIPIIAKGAMTRNHFEINRSLIESLATNGEKVYLLNLAATKDADLPHNLKEYLQEVGNTERKGKKIKNCYKCSNREPWYGVPIVRSGEVVFFKRYDICPRVCTNPTEIYTTDIAYNIRLRDCYDAESIAFCFYNSLTLAQCEFVGRYYAGGVSELTPSEFKSLRIPYRKIEKKDLDFLKEMFRTQKPFREIVEFVNSKTLAYDFTVQEIDKLDKIRIQLMGRRKTSKQ